jgi:hypothetical protein
VGWVIARRVRVTRGREIKAWEPDHIEECYD